MNSLEMELQRGGRLWMENEFDFLIIADGQYRFYIKLKRVGNHGSIIAQDIQTGQVIVQRQGMSNAQWESRKTSYIIYGVFKTAIRQKLQRRGAKAPGIGFTIIRFIDYNDVGYH